MDPNEPLDGGLPLDRDRIGGELENLLANDPCWRRERDGWHLSVGHCEEMLPREGMTGVWVTGFEESSFFPGATTMPGRNDPRRYIITLEVNSAKVAKLAGQKIPDLEYHAVGLTILGRRTKYPIAIDCYGSRSYSIVADRVIKASYLGTIGDPDRPSAPPERPPYRPFALSGDGGVIGRMEKEALARCGGSAKG